MYFKHKMIWSCGYWLIIIACSFFIGMRLVGVGEIDEIKLRSIFLFIAIFVFSAISFTITLTRNRNMAMNVLRGSQLLNLKEFDKANIIFIKALQFFPKSAQIHFLLGQSLSGKGDLYGAIQEYETAINIIPEYDEVYILLGIALHSIGMKDKAISVWQKASTSQNIKVSQQAHQLLIHEMK